MHHFTSLFYHGFSFLIAWSILLSTFPASAQQYYYKGNSATSTKVEVGDAIYYADYLHGRRTAMGETYRKEAYTCSHRTHTKGTLLKVTRMDNGLSVVVRVNDRGPYSQGAVVDISKAAAMKIGLVRDGRARVKVEPVGHSDQNPGEQTQQQPSSYNQTPRNPGTVYYNTTSQQQPSSYNQTPKNSGTAYYNTTPQQKYYSNNQYTAKGGYYSPNNTQQPSSYNNTQVPNSYNQTEELATGVKGYAIQLASFKNMANATRQVQDIRNKGIKDVYLMKRGGLNKVVIATFPNKFAAQQYLDRLRQQHLMDGIIIMLK